MNGMKVGISPSSKSSFMQKRLIQMSLIMERRSSIRDDISFRSEKEENVENE
jgi:hypothetical protein